jgi:hypothetical protein
LLTKGRLQKLRAALRYVAIVLFLPLGIPLCLKGQAPPCGVAVIRSSDGPKTDERFIPVPPEVVKENVLKALPALGYIVRKNEGLHIEAIQEIQLMQSIWETNRDAGILDARLVSGPVSVDVRATSETGTPGSQLSILFKTGFMGHKGSNAEPLAAETECLVKLLGTNDPSKNPRGDSLGKSSPRQAIKLPVGTPVKVLLFAPVYSKEYKKNSTGRPIEFVVAEDVMVDGVTVFRRGALVAGHLTDFKNAGAYGRHASLEFTFDTATAVDSQQIPVTGEIQQSKGGQTAAELESIAKRQVLLGLLMKGADVFVRAGTGYNLEVSAESLIQTGTD